MNGHGMSGLNVAPEDAKALAEAVMEIAGDGQVYGRFAAGAGSVTGSCSPRRE